MKNSRFKPYLLLMAVKVAVIGAFLLSSSSNSSAVKEVKEPNTHKLQLGIEILLEDLSALEGKKVGVVANKTSQIRKTHLVDTLLSRGINLLTIFAPEH
ncbi:MAG: hypothetical protein KDC92_06235, partial [Bacteroidetes bacterium]|nr:hypothetical protein [Bacteroidota bacterium]